MKRKLMRVEFVEMDCHWLKLMPFHESENCNRLAYGGNVHMEAYYHGNRARSHGVSNILEETKTQDGLILLASIFDALGADHENF